jgi:nitrite reductase/ring-hydroxylating ferredoxin subunit
MLRRHLVNSLLGSGIIATAASIFYPILKFVIPPETAESAVMSATAGRLEDIQPNTGKIFQFGGDPGLLVRTAEGELRAFSARCPHLNCTVQYDSDQRQIVCACHGGVFDLNGKNIAGPPPKPLVAYNVNVRADEVVVSRV